MKIVVVAVLIAIIVALFAALVFLYRDAGRGNRVVWMLTLRVALSVSLVAFLLFSYWMGWIGPGGVRVAPPEGQRRTSRRASRGTATVAAVRGAQTSQYTSTNSSSQTTSTKCQYQAAASNAK